MITLKSGVSWEEQTMAADVPTQGAQAGHLVAAAFAHQRESCEDDEIFVVF